MVKIYPVTEIAALEHVPAHEWLPPFTAAQCRNHRCDAHLVKMHQGVIVARSSLWWSEAPSLTGHTVGVIGHFAAPDAASATELLETACGELAQRGYTLAVGPMDGNTWRRYRLVTERGTEPPFFLEPNNPDDWPRWFFAANFSPLATYFSALNSDLTVEDPRIPRAVKRLEAQGVRIRPLQPEQFVDELRRIYAVSCVSFQINFLYTPIGEAEFLAQYEPLRSQVQPELVFIAEDGEKPVGYVFGIPDFAEAKRGSIKTVIVKTVAVMPGRAYAGLGNVLVARCQQAARTLGYQRAIHALMHESNNSLNLSSHYAKPFRRYTLYSRELRPVQ